MTKEQSTKILSILMMNYPDTFKGYDDKMKAMLLTIWYEGLKQFDYESAYGVAMSFIMDSTNTFMPNVGQFRERIFEMTNAIKPQMSEGEAWSLYRRALSRCGNHSEEEFAKLPPAIQRVAGSPYAMRTKAFDSNFNEGVEQSNFMRAYRAEAAIEEKKAREELLPPDLRKRLEAAAQKGLQEREQGLLGDGTDESIS